ncbi:Protein of unknown function [Chryseobacterium taichungense]|uniref:Conjugal transfer protein TraB n=1 Tax=Chryseobacterium taichungense TaxID=295069 RepID=A0A1H7VYB5_9FLAO|nr:DUF3408 domain-containing protein [Chryseobacterium taichungense]SEM13778.1 Protein of unknown function [Chryseobacterium taichungense]
MKNQNQDPQNDENRSHEKKGISNENDNGFETTDNITQPVTDDDYLKRAMSADIPKDNELIRSKSRVSGTRWSNSSGLTEKEYFETFFKIPKQNASKGRSVYIRPEFHQKFLKLIAGLEIDRLTMYAYVDNIIEHHFKEFEELIHKIYKNRNKPLF